MELSDSVALVTGADGFLGSAVSAVLVARGRAVAGAHMPQSNPPTRQGVSWFGADLGVAAAVEAMVERVERERGPITSQFHCAGGFRHATIGEISESDIDFLIRGNLLSSIYLLRALVPRFRARGFGRIVLVSSRSATAPGPGISVYAASKAGLIALVQSVAQELRDVDVTINAVAPSIIDTAANRRDMPSEDPSRWVQASELSEIMVALTEPLGRAITGAVIPVSGRV